MFDYQPQRTVNKSSLEDEVNTSSLLGTQTSPEHHSVRKKASLQYQTE